MSDQGSCQGPPSDGQDQPNWLSDTQDVIDQAAYYSTMLDELRFEAPPFPLQQATGLDRGQSSGTSQIEIEEGVKEDSDTSDRSKQRKRGRSAEVHNQNERLRRLRLKEKLKALQELIPNCNKRDKSSTFDDAIKYIKTLQFQVQALSVRAGYCSFNMMPQQGMLIPSHAPFLQIGTPGIGIKHGTRMGMGMPAMMDFPAGLPNPWLLPFSAAPRLPTPVAGVGTPLLEFPMSKCETQDPMVEVRFPNFRYSESVDEQAYLNLENVEIPAVPYEEGVDGDYEGSAE